MGNSGSECCKCKSEVIENKAGGAEPAPILDGGIDTPDVSGGSAEERIYKVVLNKTGGKKLGLAIDYVAERSVLPIWEDISEGLAAQWNADNPDKQMSKGDSILDVNGTSGDAALMVNKCFNEEVLILTLCRALNYDALVSDLEKLVKAKNCCPILIRVSWHHAAVRLAGVSKQDGDANAGSAVALTLLQKISNKYCPEFISHSDLWVLAANVAIKAMGGPDIPSRFGRPSLNAKASSQVVEPQQTGLLDGFKSVEHLRAIFHPKGFDDKAIVALSGAYKIGKCQPDNVVFDIGSLTEDPLKFDNTYFKDLLQETYTANTPETTTKGKPQNKNGNTVLLPSDLALLEDAAFKAEVEKYAKDEPAFLTDFTQAWIKLQELNFKKLRDIL